MYKTIKRIKAGGGRLEDLDIMLQLANNMGIMPGTTICGLADGAAWPVKNALAKFRGELEEYIRTHQDAGREVTPLQEAIAHGVAGRRRRPLPIPATAARPRSRTADRRHGRDRRRRPTHSTARRRSRPTPEDRRWRPSSSTARNTRSPRARSSTPSRPRSGSGSTSPTTAGTPRSRSSPTAGCARSRSAASDPKTGEIKMIPKLVPGCQTPAKDGTVLVTDSPKVKEHQRMIMEYLLINHPLDCPVCDQAGQCGLQDYSYEYGQSIHRFVEERIVNPRKDVSDAIQLNQDRCIMCTRCVRFTREITQTGELQVMRRGNHAEIDVFPGHPVDNPLAGNVVDLCPVGALLDKDFLHKQRFWFLVQARRDLHPLLDRLQHRRRGEPGPALAVPGPVQPPGQRLLDLRRGPVQLQGGQRPAPAGRHVRPRGRPASRPVADRPGARRRRARASARIAERGRDDRRASSRRS